MLRIHIGVLGAKGQQAGCPIMASSTPLGGITDGHQARWLAGLGDCSTHPKCSSSFLLKLILGLHLLGLALAASCAPRRPAPR